MFKQLTTTEKIAVVIYSCVLATIALLASLNLTIAPSYPDFIVGHITWSAETKMQDIIAVPVFVAVFFLSFVLFSFLKVRQRQLFELFEGKYTKQVSNQPKWRCFWEAKQKQLFGDEHTTELSNQLLWWSLPAIAAIFSLVSGTIIDTKLVLVSAAGIGFIVTATKINLVKKDNVSADTFSLWAFAVFLIALIPLEITLILGRATIYFKEIGFPLFVSSTFAIAVAGLVVGLVYVKWNPKKLSRSLPILLLIGQVGLCTIFLTLYPARLLQPDGVLVNYETTVWLKILVLGIILWGVSDVIYRYQKHSATTDWTKFLSPIALFALLIGLRAGNTVVPHISPDDFHFGEGLLGWWSYLYGAIPYVDFVPPHGLIDNYMPQLLSFFFYDGTAGSLEEASRLSFAILAFAAFISIYLFSGSIGLAFVSTIFLGGRLAWFFITPFLCLWFSRSLRGNPSKWLSTWLLTAPIVILGIPSKGLLLVVASGVMAAYFAWRLWRYPEERAFTGIGVSLTTLVVLGFFTPLFPMLFGAIRYVLENAPLNIVAYGIPWVLSWNVGVQRGLVFEAVRMSWVAIPIWCLAIIYASARDFARQKYTLIPVVVIFLFVMLLIPYTMGRIDPGWVLGFTSRPGLVAIFGWTILLPITAWGIIKSKNRAPLILLITCMGAALNFMPWSFLNLTLNLTPSTLLNLNLTPPSITNFISAMSSKINTPLLVDGKGEGMPNIGMAYVQAEHWDRLLRLNALLDSKLAPGETYIDLTSRNAQYFYFNRRPVIAITAPYNMVPLSQQKRAVEQLSQNLPRLALLEGYNVIHDGGGLALRNPYLYRFIVDNYIPKYVDGFIIGYRKEHALNEQESTVNIQIKSIKEAEWVKGFDHLGAMIILNDPYIISFIQEGDKVRIGSETRRIKEVWRWSNALGLEKSQIEPVVLDHPHMIQLIACSQRLAEYRIFLLNKRVALLQRAFSQSDFHKIPIAWGRSERSLENRMTLVRTLDGIEPSLHHLTQVGENFRVDDVDPFLSFDISGLHLSGRDAGFLRFDFTYVGRTAEPRIQVFWWGDHHKGTSEDFSVRFTADDGSLIIPLDASSQWLTLKHIKGIRIDLDNASIGSAFSIKNVGLFQRRL